MELAVGAALVPAHHADRPEAHLGVAADGAFVVRGRVDRDPVMAALLEQVPGQQRDRLGARAPALEAGAEVDVDAGGPYIGSSSSSYWMPPATWPSISTTSRTAESSPRSAFSIALTGSGSPHHRDTDGSARIARSRPASPGRPGRILTRRPISTG